VNFGYLNQIELTPWSFGTPSHCHFVDQLKKNTAEKLASEIELVNLSPIGFS